MRILHLSTLYPPHVVGGAEKSVALLAEAQVAHGHTVAAACISPTGAPKTNRNGVTVYRMPHENEFWMEDWPKHPMPQRVWSKFRQQFNLKIEAHFQDIIDDFKPDVINTHSLVDISTLVWRAAYRRNVPVVHTLRDYDLVCSSSSMFRNGRQCEHRHLKCKALTFTKAHNQKWVSAVAAVGGEILNRHVEMGFFEHLPPERRQVIWNAAVVEGDDVSRANREGKPFVFGYLGRISIDKGVGTLLEALKALPNGDWNVLLAGKPAESLEPVEAMATGLPVTFAGFMDPKAFFDAIDVLIVPSIWAEPLPRTVLESYFMGVPAIGARSGGIPDLIADDDWLYAPGDSQELAARMQQVIAAGRQALPGRGSFDRVLKETSPEIVCARYVGLYEKAIDAKL